jgi:glycosyltransferase involved in cell wall biosynthesis
MADENQKGATSPKVVLVGYAIPDSDFRRITQHDLYPQVQGTKLMWRLIKGFEAAAGCSIDLIGSAPASDYPRNPQIFFGYKKWSHCLNARDETIPFINIILFKHATRFISSMLVVFKWLIENRKENNKHIIVYVMHSPFLFAAIAAKLFFRIRVTLISIDMPAFMNIGIKTGVIRNSAKKLDAIIMIAASKLMDGLVVVTRHAGDVLGRLTTRKLVVEGAVELDDFPENHGEKTTSQSGKKIVMFSGALVGIEILLSAFKLVDDPNILLYISGRGPMKGDVVAAAKADNRIHYLGFLPAESLAEKMCQATVFINVRSAETPFIKYSFPSKLLEYMAFGRPTITTALPGIPDEYHKFLYLILEESPEYIARLITEICFKSELELGHFGRKARDFVMKEKNYLIQGKRLYDFICTL